MNSLRIKMRNQSQNGDRYRLSDFPLTKGPSHHHICNEELVQEGLIVEVL